MGEVLLDLTDLKWNIKSQGIGAGGMLPKCIETINGELYHYKMSAYTSTQGIYGLEAIMEVVFSRLGNLLGFSVLQYDLVHCKVKIDGHIHTTYLSKSLDFKGVQYKSISIENYDILHQNKGLDIVKLLQENLLLDDIHKIFLFDYIVCNLDRHGANIEILIDKTTAKKRVAPIFDNSLSFLTNRTEQDIMDRKYYDETIRVNNFVGASNLLSNLKKIDPALIGNLPVLEEHHKDILFEGMQSVLSQEHRAYLFSFLQRRIVDAKNI